MEPSIEIISQTPPVADKIIRYGKELSQFGELRLPSSSGKLPVVVGIHGGWWRAAYGLETQSHICATLTKAGFATWNIEYRRIGEPGGGWPGTLTDVGAAIDFLRVIENDYRLDLDHVFTLGFSAGGQLAAWAALRKNVPPNSAAYSMRTPIDIKCCISLAGALDLRFCHKMALSEDVVKQFFGGTPQHMPDRYSASSPIELIANHGNSALFRIFHGIEDTSVPYVVSQRFFNTARRWRADCSLTLLKDTHHFELIDPNSNACSQVINCILGLRQQLCSR